MRTEFLSLYISESGSEMKLWGKIQISVYMLDHFVFTRQNDNGIVQKFGYYKSSFYLTYEKFKMILIF